MSRRVQIGTAVLLLVFVFFPMVVFTVDTWPQRATFVGGLIVVSALFVFGKRWVDGRT